MRWMTAAAMAFAVWAARAEAPATGTPRLQFEATVLDFGKVTLVESVAGTFKFKNAGDGVLRIAPPKPSCGCTIASLKPDTLQPGESGELAFTLNLGRSRANLEKHISVTSNDPKTPEVSLTIRADYTPLYDVSPAALAPDLAFGVDETEQTTTITRTDGKPLRIVRLDTSKPWITAKQEAVPGGDASSARIRVTVRRDGSPRRLNENVQIHTADQTNGPTATVYLYGRVMGQVSVAPEALYWSVVDSGGVAAPGRPESAAVRRVTVRSADGKPIEIKNAESSIKGLHVELVPKEQGKSYELVARLDENPAQTVSGNLSFETSVAGQPRMEVPVIVNVYKP